MPTSLAPPGFDYDVAVVGGGPGGSSTATALARRGHRVLLLERDVFPRFHIGESQLPWINEVLQALGLAETVAASGFVEKWGASFTTADGTWDQYADFSRAVESPRPQTYQVPRDRFDRLLLDHAARCGVVVRQGSRALDVAFDPTGAVLRYGDPEGRTHDVRVKMVVDASGRAGFLARRFGRREFDSRLENIAVHAWYEGVWRREGRRAGDIQMVTRPDRGWFWFIPISQTVTSVGVVVAKAVYKATTSATADETLTRFLTEIPAAARLMRDARRISPARFDADYSYLASDHAGDRWILVGDAGAFLDPIFSTGVLLAMQSGLEAAAAISAGLAADDLSRARFAGYERRLRGRYRHFRRFVVGFYEPAFRDLFFRRGRGGLYEAVLSVLSGNWRPSLRTRLRLALFFALVAVQRVVPIAPTSHSPGWSDSPPEPPPGPRSSG